MKSNHSKQFWQEKVVQEKHIITAFIDQTFQEDQKSIISGTFSTKLLRCDNRILNLEIWDTPDQERYLSLTKMLYKDVNAAILVYDITHKNSFEKIKNFWIKDIKNNSPSNIILAIAANNNDLIDSKEVSGEEAMKLAKDLGAIFMNINVKESIDDLFFKIAKKYKGCSEVTVIEEENYQSLKRLILL